MRCRVDHQKDGDQHGRVAAANDRATAGISQGNFGCGVHSPRRGGDGERYGHISRVQTRFDYPRRNKAERGVLRAYLVRTSGYSRAQLTRLVTRWGQNRLGAVPLAKCYRAPAAPFARKYTESDIELLVGMDRANEDVCGPAIVHLLQ